MTVQFFLRILRLVRIYGVVECDVYIILVKLYKLELYDIDDLSIIIKENSINS